LFFLQKLENIDKEEQVEYRSKHPNTEECECISSPIPVKGFEKHIRHRIISLLKASFPDIFFKRICCQYSLKKFTKGPVLSLVN